MRDLKFRAWHKIAKKMFYTDNASIFRWSEHEKQPIEIMQFTGLKDKNGKEIYEGDIVNFAKKKKICDICSSKDISSELTSGINNFCPVCGKEIKETYFITTAEVVFDKGGFAYKWSNKESYYQCWQTHVAEIYIEWVEVVGNIFLNPELLNDSAG